MTDLSEKLHSAPFVRLICPFIAGIFIGDHCSVNLKWYFFALFTVFYLLLFWNRSSGFKNRSNFGILLLFNILLAAIFLTTEGKYYPKILPNCEYFAIVDEYPVVKDKSCKLILRLTEPKATIIAYLDKAISTDSLEPGRVIWFHGQLEVLQTTGNPFEFDYASYCFRNEIGHRIYLKKGNFFLLPEQYHPNLKEYSLILREKLIKLLENSGLKGEELHLVSSVALGSREDLEPETVQSFAQTGVTHVLAVSGMNVGIIYIVFAFLLRPVKRIKSGLLIETLVILAGIWGYSLITGLSASVLRAAMMFSFIVIGKSINRNSNIYNTLASSAFVLLVMNPFLVFDVGFQLSYAAVFSIVFFHPFIYKLLYFRYWVSDQIWLMISVSIAAQIGTLPFLLHYFHQFPTWFLLANLMVIPLVTLILYLSFVVFAVAPIVPWLGHLMTLVLDYAGKGMLFSVRFVEKLPCALITNLYPDDFILLICVLTFIFLGYYFLQKRRMALIFALVCILIGLIFSDIVKYQEYTRCEVVVFNLQGRILFSLTAGEETTWITSAGSGPEEKLNYYTKPYEGFRGIKRSKKITLTDTTKMVENDLIIKGDFLNFKGLTIFCQDERKSERPGLPDFPSTDLFIVSGKSTINPGDINKNFPEAIFIENRKNSKTNESYRFGILNGSENRFFNTFTGGSVVINFSVKNDGTKKILNGRYFGH